MPRTVITFGTYDVFHVGHLRMIERAAALGDRLVVGVSADALNLSKKGREPVFSQVERMAIVGALRMVDEVFVEESLELKRDYIEQFHADVLVMGDDRSSTNRNITVTATGGTTIARYGTARPGDH